MSRNGKSATIHDVAVAAGVSISTVSRVLNNKDDVSLETREKVRRVIDELDYSSSLAAKGMRSHHTNVIGLIMPDVASPYSIEIMRGVNRAISKLDYDLLIYTNGDIQKYNTADQERFYVSLLNGSVTDGAIVVTPAAVSFPTVAPLVAIDPNNESPDYPGIIANNKEGAEDALNYLLSLGHRRIGFITGRLDLVSANHRLQGYKDALVSAGIPVDDALIQVSDYTTEMALLCARVLLGMENPPTAIFASNDMSAVGVYQAAKEAGVRIPEDLSVIGFDNLPESACLNPALTTIDQFVAEMGGLAIEMVVNLLKGKVLENNLNIIQSQLVIRKSCASVG
jgi:LacI family transcriptional regulator